jgi:hypothetical protein
LLRVTQSAADGVVEEPAAVELAGAEADVAGAGDETGADVAVAVGVELDDEPDELQPTMRAPLAARTARTVSDERRDISGTSRGVEHERGSNSNHPKSYRKASPSHQIPRSRQPTVRRLVAEAADPPQSRGTGGFQCSAL